MRGVGVDVDGLPTRGLAKVCHECVHDDCKVVQNGVKSDTHGSSDEVQSRTNGEENVGCLELRQAQAISQNQHGLQHLPQSSVVRWDRFLPLRSLKVLLVENDDSTRHVVSALLRNCSYEVTSVSNGLEAWKMLADLTNHIDLVLTEVAMPGLSGIGLLSKIMNHKSCKNIPVIMTSSNDSMGIVFKCLSKGAVDFLVKPIRKNELKNLWQHVWRKCHSSSGSGSESGTRTQKSIKSKNVQGSDNHSDSNDEDEDEDERSIGLIYRNGSDNGSGTQSSWSKRAVEVDSPRPMSPWEGSAEPPDSTCALVIHSKPEVDSTSWVPTNAAKKSKKQNDLSDNMAMGKDLRIGVLRDPDMQIKGPSNEVLANATNIEKGTRANADMERVRDKLRSLEYHNDTKKDKLLGKDNDLMGANTNITMADGGSAGSEVPNNSSKSTTVLKDMAPSNTKELPSVMPSLKRLRESNAGTTTQERNVLRHSDHSAFSRYNTASTAHQATTAVVGSCSPANNSSEAAKAESLLNLQSNSSGTPNQGSNGSSNNNDMGSTTNKGFTKSEVLTEKPTLKSTALGTRPSSTFQPVQHGHNSALQPVTSGKLDVAKTTPGQQPQVEHHHHHHYHHHHHHVHNLQQQQNLLNSEDISLRNMITGSPQFGQSNMLNGGIEDDATNYGSASGSNNRSNGQNGSSTVVVEETNMASAVGTGGTGKCGTVEVIIASGNRSGMDQDRLAQREAALNKFRQKRKERCFDKKVRYQSRKKLAEQRPRIRGQFVRQTVDENKIKDKSNNPDS